MRHPFFALCFIGPENAGVEPAAGWPAHSPISACSAGRTGRVLYQNGNANARSWPCWPSFAR